MSSYVDAKLHTKDQVYQALQHNELDKVITSLPYLKDLDNEIARVLITCGMGWEVGENIESFNKEFHQSIADQLIETHQPTSIIANLQEFSGCNPTDLMCKLIDHGAGTDVVFSLSNYDFFTKDDLSRMVQSLKDYGDQELLNKLHIFLNQVNITTIDYGEPGNIPLKAHLLEETRFDIDRTPIKREDLTTLVVELNGQIITKNTPEETIKSALTQSKNGFDSWKTMSDIQRKSYESAVNCTLKQLGSLSILNR